MKNLYLYIYIDIDIDKNVDDREEFSMDSSAPSGAIYSPHLFGC